MTFYSLLFDPLNPSLAGWALAACLRKSQHELPNSDPISPVAMKFHVRLLALLRFLAGRAGSPGISPAHAAAREACVFRHVLHPAPLFLMRSGVCDGISSICLAHPLQAWPRIHVEFPFGLEGSPHDRD
jgi:hypothetical protein